MDEKVFFHLSYETMLGDTEDFINACLERANRADCNDADAEIARARSAIELWYHLGDGGPCPGRRRRQGPSAPHRNAPARSHSRTTFMAAVTTSRRPSPLQRRVLIVLAALDAKRPGPVATRDIERVLEQGGDAPVYGPNLRASCRRMEAAGWLRTLRAPNLQLAVELTEAGRGIAEPLFRGRTRG